MKFRTQWCYSLFAMIILSGTGCVQKRPTIEGDRENLADLVVVKSLVEPTCDIETLGVQQKLNSSGAQKVDIKTNPEFGIKALDIVDFKSNCAFLEANKGAIELLGLPNTKVKAKYEIDANQLTLFKLLTDDQLSHLERPYARREGALWKVPIGGFKITGFFNVVHAKNSEDRETNVLVRQSVDNRNFAKADYVTFNREEFISFKRVVKTDVFPKNFFMGSWYYGKTVVNTRFQSGLTGGVDVRDANFLPASKIEFQIEKDFLVAVNANLDQRLRSKDHNLNLDTAIRIPLRNVEYRQVPEGSGFALGEEEVHTRTPQEARYIELKFVDSQTVETVADNEMMNAVMSLFRRKLNNLVVLKDVVVRDDYFSFTLEDRGADQEVRYSFMRIRPDRMPFTPRVAFREDMLKFGFFESEKNRIVDEQLRTQSDVEKITFLDHFNPNSEIVYHFSTTTPAVDWVRDIGREAIGIWQQAFKKAGLKTTIRLEADPSADQEIGDIRYNILNMSNDDTGSFLGLGSSLADSQTGEIVSATANLYLYSEQQFVLAELRRYVAEKTGERFDFTNSLQISPAINKLRLLSQTLQLPNYSLSENQINQIPSLFTWKNNGSPGMVFQPLVTDQDVQEMSAGQIESAAKLLNKINSSGIRLTHVLDTEADARAYFEEDWALDQFVETSESCTAVRDLVERYKNTSLVPTTMEMVTATRPCSIPLTQFSALRSLVHEIGHNLGLRHNFMGSQDVENYLPIDTFELKYISIPKGLRVAKSSSVMDYYGAADGIQVDPGAYDIAAIQFAYAGQILDRNNQTFNLDTTKTIFENVGDQARRYSYCSDEHAISGTDPFCVPHDRGNTSLTNVKLKVREMFRMLEATYRYHSAQKLWNPVSDLLGEWLSISSSLKRHYDRWRLLVAQEVGIDRAYLQGVSVSEYRSIVERLLNSPRRLEVEDLLKSRNVMVLALLDLAFMPNRYCVAQTGGGDEVLVELANLRKSMQRLGYTDRVTSCSNPSVLEVLKQKGFIYRSEVGFDLDDGSYELDTVRATFGQDFVGIGPIRGNAMALLSTRNTPLRLAKTQEILPAMLDEPDIRELVTSLLQHRIINGVVLPLKPLDLESYAEARLLDENDLKVRVLSDNGLRSKDFLNFKDESKILITMLDSVVSAMTVPGAQTESAERLAPYHVVVTQSPKLLAQQMKNSIQLNPSTYLGTPVSSEVSFASKMIDRLRLIQANRSLGVLPAREVEAVAKQLMDFISQNRLALELNKSTNLDFVRYANAVQSFQARLEEKNERVAAKLTSRIIQPDLDVLPDLMAQVFDLAKKANLDQNSLLVLIQGMVNGKILTRENETQVFNFLNQKVDSSIFEKTGFPDPEGIQKRIDKVIETVRLNQQINAFSGQELDAQADLLTQLLIGLSKL